MEVTAAFGERYHPIRGEWHYHSGCDLGTDYNEPIVALRFVEMLIKEENALHFLELRHYNALNQETCVSKFLPSSAFQRSGGYACRLFTP